MNMLNWQQISSPCSFIPCSERIHVAVTEMAALFPKVREGFLVYTTDWTCCCFESVSAAVTPRSKRISVKLIGTVLCRSHAQTLWEALCACWPPARIGFRASVGRRCLQRAARDRTCSWSPSRSSNVLMTLQRQPSSLSPSPQRRIPTKSTYRGVNSSASQFGSYIYCIFMMFFLLF